MKYLAATATIALALALANCGRDLGSGLTPSELAQCRSSGGYETVSPFGFPFCQMDYADGGKVCQGQSDCTGRCLSEAPENAGDVAVGTAVTGRCEPQKSTFGCHGRVENGQLAEPYICED